MPELPVLDHDAVLSAVPAALAIERVREALIRFHHGEWTMPPKIYLESPPFGDFRAMPAGGEGLALLKWVTSFPGNPARGLPTVTGLICLSDAATGELLMVLDARSVTALRTGGVPAVAGEALAPAEARSIGVVGCGLHGAWTARCLVAAGLGPGICCDVDAGAATRLAAELGRGWRPGERADALGCDIVCCITPGSAPVVDADDLRPGLHLNMLGADSTGLAIQDLAVAAAAFDAWRAGRVEAQSVRL